MPLPGEQGSRALGRDQLLSMQRARLVAATVEVVGEQGARSVTVTDIVGRACMSRRTFYEAFTDYGHCLLATLEATVTRIAVDVAPAFEGKGRWRERLRASLVALLGYLDEHPDAARLCVIEAGFATPATMAYRARAIDALTAAVDQARGESPGAAKADPIAAEGVVGAALAIVQARLLDPTSPQLIELTGPLMSLIVLPYLGAAAARAEREKPAPVPVRPIGRQERPFPDPPSERPLKRVTYRSLRVLSAVQQTPSSGNRAIADLAGMKDPGQTSKLLKRLQGVGLLSNEAEPVDAGSANRWRLTPRGEQLLSSLEGDR